MPAPAVSAICSTGLDVRRLVAGTDVPTADRPPSAGNVAALVLDRARHLRERPALVLPTGEGGACVVRYGELGRLIAGYALGLREQGLRPGDRVVVLAPPSAAFYALALALLAEGLTLVLVDGRMAPRRVLGALEDARARAVVTTPALMRWWPAIAPLRRALRFTADGRVPGARPLARLWRERAPEPAPHDVPGDAPAIISFTSGSTGRAKGVLRTHDVLLAQHRALGALFPAAADDVHLTSLPVASLHGLCCGTTTVLCRPERATPAALHALLGRHRVTCLSGGPAFVEQVAGAALAAGGPFLGLRRVVVGGAPVSRRLCRVVRQAFPAAAGHVVYGATEAEPIATAPLREVEGARGPGFLVGRPAAGTEVALAAPVADGHGEVMVRGPHVTNVRLGASSGDGLGTSPGASRRRAAGWHRTGDLAHLDPHGRLWLLGHAGSTVTHRGRVLYPYEVEAEVLAHDAVHAAGLVAHRRAPEGELAVVLAPGADARGVLEALRERLDAMGLPALPLRAIARMPVDARHASKVRRRALARLLARGLR